jgi:hypothetical protein
MTFPLELTAPRTGVGSHQAHQVNFLLRVCRYCDVEFLLGPGDVVFGDRWYHGRCWDKLKAATTTSEITKTG